MHVSILFCKCEYFRFGNFQGPQLKAIIFLQLLSARHILDRDLGAFNQVLRTKGNEWTMANLGISQAPYKLTVWDYFSVTTGSYVEDVWTYTWILIGFAVGFKMITLYSMAFTKHLNR
jgi:hypothetical protein